MEKFNLTAFQLSLWFEWKLRPKSTAYNLPAMFKVTGNLNLPVLTQSLRYLTIRHDSLRTHFEEIEDVPYQLINDEVDYQLEFFDYSKKNNKILDKLIDEKFNIIFDLKEPPLFRLSVIKIGINSHFLIFNFHHIIIDGNSQALFFKEFSEIYNAFSQRKEILLPDISITIKDVLAYEENYLHSEQYQQDIKLWQEKLFDSLFYTPISYKNIQKDYKSSTFYFELSKEMTTGLQKLATKQKSTLFLVLMSCFKTFLFRYTGQEDISINYSMNVKKNIPILSESNFIGYFVNLVCNRTQFNSKLTMKNVINKITNELRSTKNNSNLPIINLVQTLRKINVNEGYGICNIFFGASNFIFNLSLVNLEVESIFTQLKHAQNEFLLLYELINHKITLKYWFSNKFFSEWFMDFFSNHFNNFLREVVNNPSQVIGKIPLFSKEERKKILFDWNATDYKYPKDKTILQLFEEQVKRTPENIAVLYEEESLNYQELDEKSNQLAHIIRNKYKERFDVNMPIKNLYCIYVERNCEMIIGILAILKSGAAYVPLDANDPSNRLLLILKDTNCKLILTQKKLLEKISFLASEEREIICLDNYHKVDMNAKKNNLEQYVLADDLAYIIYTSGSTGHPKGVEVKQRGVVRLVKDTNYIVIDPTCCIGQLASMSFDAATFEIWGALLNGAKLVIISKEKFLDAQTLLLEIEKNSINILFLTTSLFNQLVDTNPLIFQNLHYLLVGGESASLSHMNKVIEQCKKTKLIHVYGPTENTTFTSYCHIQMISSRSVSIPIGKPISNTKVYVLDPYLQPVPIGVTGELYAGGSGVARGYLNRPELTAERFILNPFATKEDKANGYDHLYKTGDLVRWLPDGNLEYIGRNDFQVKIRGYRVELEEIENDLNNYPTIKQSKVIVREHEGNKYLVAYYVAKQPIAENNLLKYLAKELPEYMIPNAFIYLKSLPLTSSGKVDHRALPEPEFEEKLPYEAPRDELEETICMVWQKLLGIGRVGIYDNFFRIGGTSILAIKLAHQLSRELKQHVNVASLFLYSTVVSLASMIIHHGKNIHIEKYLTDKAELSFAQTRLRFIEQFEEGTNAYNIPLLIRLMPEVKLKAFKRSLVSIVDRHEVLRTVFKTDENTGFDLQVVLSKPLIVREIHVQDLEFKQSLQREINHIFRLTQEYPFRAIIYHLGASVYALLVVHHIAFDGWSLNIFLKELHEYYWHYAEAKKLDLFPIEIQYKDFSMWQRKYLSGEILAQEVNYWEKKLFNYQPLSLRTDNPRPALLSYVGEDIYFEVEQGLSKQLRFLAKEQEVTLYTVLLSGFYLLLYRYTNELDLIIGTPLANRHYEQIENLIGFFVNTLVLRVQLNLKQTVRAFIQTVHAILIEAQEHQDLPFEKLIEILKIERDPSRHPLVQIVFSVQSFGKEIDQNLFKFESVAEYYKVAKFDLSVFIDDSEAKLTGCFNYASHLYHRETINQIKNHYLLILKEFVQNPKKILQNIRGMSNAEYKKVIYRWNTTDLDFPKDKTFMELFKLQANRTPKNIAICYEKKSLNYQELDQRSDQLAQYIQHRYMKQNQTEIIPDTLIAICVKRSLEMIVGILAILKAGAAYVPIDPDVPQKRLHYIINDTHTKMILTQERLVKKIRLHFHGSLILLDKESYQEEKEITYFANVRPQHLAYVIYTSGTTNHPKGVMVEHQNLTNFLYAINEILDISTDDAILALTSYTFDISVLEFYLPLINGARCIVIKKETSLNSNALIKTIQQKHISVLQATPATLYLLQQAEWKFPDKIKILSGGEALSPMLARKMLTQRKKFWNVYGPTEATVWASAFSVKKIIFENYVPIGKPLSNIRLLVLNDSLQPVPLGAVGELYIGGAGVARGYLNHPELTTERFIENPFATKEDRLNGYYRLYKTGDLVRWLSDGNLEYIGRNDFQIKIRGYRVELGEIESNLNNYPLINQSVVVVHEREGNKYLVAYYVAEKPIADKSLMNYLIKELPDYMIPTAFVYLKSFPLTSSGKIDRKSLPEAELKANVGYVAPRNKIEEKLTDLWQRILNLKKVGINDDFFKIGGDSISAIRTLAMMKKELDIEIKTSAFFSLRTIHLISDFLKKETGLQRSIVSLNKVRNQKNKLFMIHPAASDSEAYLDLAAKLENDYLCFGVENYNLHNKKKIVNLNKLAKLYLKNVKTLCKEDDYYFLLGWSLGGNIALEMAYLLEQEGIKYITVYLLDTALPDNYIKNHIQGADIKRKTKARYIQVGLDPSHIKKLMLTYKAKINIASSALTGRLNYAQVILFKAMEIDEETTEFDQEFFKHIISLKNNNLGNYCKKLKIINLSCSHSNIIKDVDQISKWI